MQVVIPMRKQTSTALQPHVTNDIRDNQPCLDRAVLTKLPVTCGSSGANYARLSVQACGLLSDVNNILTLQCSKVWPHQEHIAERNKPLPHQQLQGP